MLRKSFAKSRPSYPMKSKGIDRLFCCVLFPFSSNQIWRLPLRLGAQILLLTLVCFLPQYANAQSIAKLSDKARVSLITCGAGPILYEAFGHSAVRISDPGLGMDVVFNYGIFDFNQPNFYGNFALGYMRYQLGASPADEFLYQYRYFKRSVREQVLNLDSSQKQAVFDYLNVNLLPENQEYYYDYFYNNCSTKIVEMLDSALKNQVVWHPAAMEGKGSYRKLIHQYTVFQPWGRLGIDLGLGAVIDQPINGQQLDFLPDGLERDVFRAEVRKGTVLVPLTLSSSVLYDAPAFYGDDPYWLSPGFVFSFLLFLSILLVWKSDSLFRFMRIWRSIQFLLVGILGWVELLIWILTNHKAAAWNFNLLWANPLFLFLGAVWPWIEGRFPSIRILLLYYLGAVLALWFFLPQELNPVLIPLVMSLFVLAWGDKKQLPNSTVVS